jgi:hypothetical protein
VEVVVGEGWAEAEEFDPEHGHAGAPFLDEEEPHPEFELLLEEPPHDWTTSTSTL